LSLALCAPLSSAACEWRTCKPVDDLRLSGRKDFVTAGDAADWLLIAARSEAPATIRA
jgi:alkylation response protein AidB-like acyl-CoA dehydrogenase